MFPADYGWSLGVTYAVWIGVVVVLYPVCLWFSQVQGAASRLVGELSLIRPYWKLEISTASRSAVPRASSNNPSGDTA